MPGGLAGMLSCTSYLMVDMQPYTYVSELGHQPRVLPGGLVGALSCTNSMAMTWGLSAHGYASPKWRQQSALTSQPLELRQA